MLLTVAEHEKKIFILSDIENAAAVLIYLAGGCKCAYPLIGTSDHWGEVTPYWIAWILYLIGAFLIAFNVSRTICITSRTVSIENFWGVVSHQYRWNEILFWGKWKSTLHEIPYIYLSVRSPKHIFLFESMKQCHFPDSKELFALVSLLKTGNACVDCKPERLTSEELSKNRRRYYRIRFIGAGIPVLFSLVIMFFNSFAVWCVAIVIGMVVSAFYQLASEPVLSQLEAEYYKDFIAYRLSQ